MSDPSAMFRTPATAYDRWVGRYSGALAAKLVEAAGGAHGRVLDVGCGPGALTTVLAAAVGPANVVAVDPSPEFAAACRTRNPGVDVREGAAEHLELEEDAFDATFSQLVVNFLRDAHQGLREMRRVTRPGGVVAAAVWDYRGEMVLLRRFWDAALALDPEAADEGASMPYATPEALEALWRETGLEHVAVTSATVDAGYDGFDDLWAPLEQGVGPAGAHVIALDRRARAALRAEVRDRLGVGDQPFRLSGRAWIATGTVPGTP